MIESFMNLHPVCQGLLATLFTYGITMLGASLVFFFKDAKNPVLSGRLEGNSVKIRCNRHYCVKVFSIFIKSLSVRLLAYFSI